MRIMTTCGQWKVTNGLSSGNSNSREAWYINLIQKLVLNTKESSSGFWGLIIMTWAWHPFPGGSTLEGMVLPAITQYGRQRETDRNERDMPITRLHRVIPIHYVGGTVYYNNILWKWEYPVSLNPKCHYLRSCFHGGVGTTGWSGRLLIHSMLHTGQWELESGYFSRCSGCLDLNWGYGLDPGPECSGFKRGASSISRSIRQLIRNWEVGVGS